MNLRIWLYFMIMLAFGLSGCVRVIVSNTRPQNSSFLEVSISSIKTGRPFETSAIASATPTSTYTLAPSPTMTTTSTPTPTLTPTIAPTATHTPTPTRIVIGGADKIAYLNGNEIWTANLDGSDLAQLSFDGKPKTNLQWSPDGRSIIYISPENKCVYSISIENAAEELVSCFTFTDYFKAFEVSPDGKQVAISVDNLLYVLPFDKRMLKSIERRSDLPGNAVCEYFDPLQREPKPVDPRKNVIAKFIRWSTDSQQLAFVTHGWEQDILKFIEYNCASEPSTITTFYPDYFLPTPDLYKKNPIIHNFGWDSNSLVAIIAIADRETGFGTLYLYDYSLKKAFGPFKGISECCYRDPIFSPDGKFLAFAYRAYLEQNSTTYYDLGSDIKIYIIPLPLFSKFSSQGDYTPLPLPAIAPLSKPQIVLRPVIATPVP